MSNYRLSRCFIWCWLLVPASPAYLVAPAVAISIPRLPAADDKFEVASERPTVEIPLPFTGHGDRHTFGALSPDGRSVLVVRKGGLSVRPWDSVVETELLPPESIATIGLQSWAVWSADGRQIYYPQLTDRAGIVDLWRLDIASRKKARLIANAGGVITPLPQPSPDGRHIAFCRRQTLMLAGADGQNERVLWESSDPFGRLPNLMWSPDSSQILVPTSPESFTKLSLIEVSTRKVTPLTPWKRRYTEGVKAVIWPAWSSGPFLCANVYQHIPTPGSLVLQGVQIWHLSLPSDERAQVTTSPYNYVTIFGAASDGYSLIVQRTPPQSGPLDHLWDSLVRLAVPGPRTIEPPADFHPTLLLTLRK